MKTQILFNSSLENSKNPSVYKASLFDWDSETGFLAIFYKIIFLFNSSSENFKNHSVYKASLFNSNSENQF